MWWQRVLGSPLLGGVSAIVLVAWEAISSVGIPPSMPTSVPWTWIAFVFFSMQSIIASIVKIRKLEGAAKPRLEIVFDPTSETFVKRYPSPDGQVAIYFRVGVVNIGAISVRNVAIKLVSCEPSGQGTHPGHELRQTGQKGARFDVNKSSEPLVLVDVAIQILGGHPKPTFNRHLKTDN